MSIDFNITQEKLNGFQKKAHDSGIAAGMPKEHLDMILMESTGGDCPKCGMRWGKVEVKNSVAEFEYYDPACDCYGRCPDCKTSWHREISAGSTVGEIRRCVSCGWLKYPEYARTCTKCGGEFMATSRETFNVRCPDCLGQKAPEGEGDERTED